MNVCAVFRIASPHIRKTFGFLCRSRNVVDRYVFFFQVNIFFELSVIFFFFGITDTSLFLPRKTDVIGFFPPFSSQSSDAPLQKFTKTSGRRASNEAVSQYGGRRIAWGEVCRDEARHRLVGRVGDAFRNINAARFERTTANKAFLSTTSSRAAKTAPEWVPFGGGKR